MHGVVVSAIHFSIFDWGGGYAWNVSRNKDRQSTQAGDDLDHPSLPELIFAPAAPPLLLEDVENCI